jgi:hypothetical protein
MRPFQLFAALRHVPESVQRSAALLTEWLIRHVTGSTRSEEMQRGYLLIVARKS